MPCRTTLRWPCRWGRSHGLVEGLRRDLRAMYLASALLAGLLPWMMVHTGLAVLAIGWLAISGARSKRRWIGSWLAVAAIPSITVFGVYLLWGPFDTFVRTVFLAPIDFVTEGFAKGTSLFPDRETSGASVTPEMLHYVVSARCGARPLAGTGARGFLRIASSAQPLSRSAANSPIGPDGTYQERGAGILDRCRASGRTPRGDRCTQNIHIESVGCAGWVSIFAAIGSSRVSSDIPWACVGAPDRSWKGNVRTALAGGILRRRGLVDQATWPRADRPRYQCALRLLDAPIRRVAASSVHVYRSLVSSATHALGGGSPCRRWFRECGCGAIGRGDGADIHGGNYSCRQADLR